MKNGFLCRNYYNGQIREIAPFDQDDKDNNNSDDGDPELKTYAYMYLCMFQENTFLVKREC